MILIKLSSSAENDEEDNDGSFSVKDFLQSNGGTTQLMEIKVAIEDLKTPSKSVSVDVYQEKTTHFLSICVIVLCKFCYQQTRTMLKVAIQKIHKAILNVQKYRKKCHSAEIKGQSTTQYQKTMQSNKKQRTTVSTKEEKAHAVSVFEKSLYQYINDLGTMRDNIEEHRFRQMFLNAYTVFHEKALLHVFLLVDTSLKGCRKNLS